LAWALLFGVPKRRRTWRKTLGMLTLLITLTCGLQACAKGGGGGVCEAGTTPGLYTVAVTGTSAEATTTTSIAVTVK
jgi:hypothetical protein